MRQMLAIAAFLMASLSAHAAPPPEDQVNLQVKQLLVLMDRDRSGKVSRNEFMNFMSTEFDRLDTNKDGELDIHELEGLRITGMRHNGGTTK